METNASESKKEDVISTDYEIFGKVQGVYFRKYTEDKANSLGIVGWVMNTEKGTVTGTIQGPSDKIKEMKYWLANVGSPNSKIEGSKFRNEKTITEYEFKNFEFRK